jgi:DNA topoisomerase VI subunit A
MFERTSMLQKDQETATSYKETGIMKLTERDRKLATRMLGNDVFIMNEEWRSEIQGMLNMNMKAEIQFMGKGAELGDWLDGKLKLSSRQ